MMADLRDLCSVEVSVAYEAMTWVVLTVYERVGQMAEPLASDWVP